MNSEPLTSDSRPLTPESWRPAHALIPAWQRTLLMLTSLILIGLLTTAACLSPNPSGMETHRQLGFPPCTSVMLFGVRCPACGMTTSWAHLMRGHLIESARVNTGGLMLGLISIVVSPWLLVSAVRGRWWIGPLDPSWVLAISGVVMIVTLVQWVGRLLG